MCRWDLRLPEGWPNALWMKGNKVAKGDVLARLENEDQTIALALARASLARAESMLAETHGRQPSRRDRQIPCTGAPGPTGGTGAHPGQPSPRKSRAPHPM